MGNERTLLEGGGFSEPLYHQIGETITVGDISGKVIEKIVKDFTGLPLYANKSTIYLKKDEFGRIVQMRLYVDRKAALDFDWDHGHGKFVEGVVHVHEWGNNNNGKWRRCTPKRYMNDDEIGKYAEFLRRVDPMAKFRP